jgi:C-terminal processing protease CtpA/Prc
LTPWPFARWMRIDPHIIPVLLIAAGLQSLAVARPPQPPPRIYDFERDTRDQVPDGWFVPAATATAGATARVTAETPAEGGQCVELSKKGDQSFGNLMQSFGAGPYRGLRVRFSASVRAVGGAGHSRAQLWMRVDRANGQVGFFDNMGDRPIRSTEWSRYEIIGDVGKDARTINLGLMMLGPGRAWIDDVSFEVMGEAGLGAEPARALTDRGAMNISAFARLLGYVRHFHPSDEAAATDWEQFAIRGVHVVEVAADADDLAARLEALFGPIAPSVEIAAGGLELTGPRDDGATGFTYWVHYGFGQGAPEGQQHHNIYRSWRRELELDEADTVEPNVPDPGATVERDLGGGVRCRVPVCLYRDRGGTFPRTDAGEQEVEDRFDWDPPPGWFASGDDRGTRLAAVILAWNVFQHYYPYFDVVDTDWNAVLEPTLRRAAEDPDADAFLDTLRRMVDSLHDGHGRVGGRGGLTGAYRLPFTLGWIQDELVVTHAPLVNGVGPNAGDVVLSIDGRTPRQLWDDLDPIISGATEQWARYRALAEIAARDGEVHFTAELCRPDGLQYSIRSQAVAPGPHFEEPRPEKVARIEPGIWYLDLNRINDEDFRRALPDLEQARGVVFDLRGYPSHLSVIVIAHLINEPVTCAQWHVPVVRWPDRERMEFRFSNWQVDPQKPRLKARAAFITDGRAISYAETYLGIIEHYELAEIVGGPTAGTNGNVNPITLPGGYSISWTGMKVLKHDGSRHHGAGIQPTVPVERTIGGVAAGRDELLEAAVEIVKGDAQ